MEKILAMEDKAKNVFKYINLVSKHKGNMTLKQLTQQAKASK
ncbi:MAG TPA: hypothetical protein VGA85_04820 [Dehalococcoidales bacterium]